jgi:polyisoprenoid-binding protein YceI
VRQQPSYASNDPSTAILVHDKPGVKGLAAWSKQMLKRPSLAAAVAGLLWTAPAKAVTHTVALEPRSAQVTFRAYGLGIVPIEGAFTRFNGALVLDPANPATCEVNVQAEAASLAMPEAGITQDALGPELLDVTRHPVFAYSGRCGDGQVRGTLLLHGIIPVGVKADLCPPHGA